MADNKFNKDNNGTSHENQEKFVKNENEMNEDQRVKILSPSMLVIKRFMRNRLAIVGTLILVVMILFSFVGGAVIKYEENQTFYKKDQLLKDYASASLNTQPTFYYVEDVEFPNSLVQFELINVVVKGGGYLAGDGYLYTVTETGEGTYLIAEGTEVGTVNFDSTGTVTDSTFTGDVTDEVRDGFLAAVSEGKEKVEIGGTEYTIVSKADNSYTLCSTNDIGVSTNKVISLIDPTNPVTFEYMHMLEEALVNDEASFDFDGSTYTVEESEYFDIIYKDGAEFASLSDYSMRAVENDVLLSLDLRAALSQAISEGSDEITFENVIYKISNKDTNYTISTFEEVEILDRHAYPSSKHWLGTDKDGMDNLTRLMYGGRVSLFIGLVVVFIELLIGVILGGIAGYFGGWVDNLIMRIVDIVICIPSMPIYIILGSVMDTMQVDAQMRIFYLMFVLGILSWPGICRIVRAQILSLREQEFMIATEATGISVSKRIFRHLIPNVIPQLIVIATMDLGSIILTEATLSFLGLGVKFPFASWGNIINAVNNSYVMTHYWFEWIPAGFLILITVLGFNFVGDGLRDAFDPKMKR